MYEFILPLFKTAGIQHCYLEVLDQNIPAIKSYKSVGFTAERELVCFKGIPRILESPDAYTITELKKIDWKQLTSFWDWQPSWQNSVTALENIGTGNRSIGIYTEDRLLAYANYNPQNNRISQFAVDKEYRKQGLGSALFQYLFKENEVEISLINIDATAAGTISFLKSIGLTPFVNQLEMKKKTG
ncbi:Acetyltransferase (GNAT) family protein [compost metagenome]